MSTGRKRSGFQITSVTSDYGQAGSDGHKESFASDTGSPNLAPLTNGGHILPMRSPRGSPRSSPPASVSTHQVGSGDVPLLNSEPNVKEVDAGSADKIRTALPQSHDEGVVRPVTVDEKVLTLPLDSGVTLVVPIIKTDDTPSSQQGPISSVTHGNEHAPNGTQTSSSNSQIPVNTSIGHAPLVNGISSQTEIKAGSSNGAIPKNGPLSSVVNGSLISPVITAGPAAAASSRFRVVKLDQGLGEPYKKGRWMCVDFYDKDMDSHSISKILDSMRHGHSLDSHLEVAGLSNKPVTQFYPQLSGKGHGTSFVHSQGTAHLVLNNATLNVTNPQQARSLSGLPQISLERGQGVGLKSPISARNSPTSEFNPLLTLLRTNDATQRSRKTTSPTDVHPSSAVQELTGFPASGTSSSEDLGNREQHTSAIPRGVSSQGPQGFHVVPVVVVDEPTTSHPISKHTLPLIQTEDRRKLPTRRSRSRSPSPARPRFRDNSPSTNLSDPFNVHSARLSLARSMFSISGTSDSDDESGSGSSMVAIDNKIEQAMDLVKTHLMFAVREEVEFLREQIKDLLERNTLLEQENNVLKSLASTEQLSEMQAKMYNLRLGLAPPPASSSTA